ncbi:PGAP1-like protein-domain-containing protein [Flagelloscypha sp. PMI_526]|nr:PGAP1-like protein-domain-containing protein [Flagelloscypha sp. PMI_526]
MKPTTLNATFALVSLALLGLFLRATLTIQDVLSPQGCRMSRMWPSYLLQTEFNTSWTPLARRYRLFLYREKEQYVTYWQPPNVGDGLPVLFIPGNAGSHAQVRSIASSAARQYFDSPGVVSKEFKEKSAIKPLDFFAVDFNEDLSAFHGPTMESEIEYTSKAIDYILTLYPSGTHILLMGHSMGGIIAASLLPSAHISAIITMSTPHTLPPARFDARIDGLYDHTLQMLRTDKETPIVSICGGATDMMIPSESCVLPSPESEGIFRRTVFSSALEGAWTGVGHREMVWCHQVRWRVARAALELGHPEAQVDVGRKGKVLDSWLRDGHLLPPSIQDQGITETLNFHEGINRWDIPPVGRRLALSQPKDAKTTLLPVPRGKMGKRNMRFVLYVSKGGIRGVAPQVRSSMEVSVYHCVPSPNGGDQQEGFVYPSCRGLKPFSLKLVPLPKAEKPFPVPGEGADESEGVVVYEATLEVDAESPVDSWIAVKVDTPDRTGWVVGGFDEEKVIVNDISTFGLILQRSAEVFVLASFAPRYHFPGLASNALLVHRISRIKGTLPLPNPICASASLMPPLLEHTSSPSETHYFPIRDSTNVLLHTHGAAPFIESDPNNGVEFTIYTTERPECVRGDKLVIRIDWTATLGRWTNRYFTTVLAWSIGIVLLVMFESLKMLDVQGSVPSVGQSIARFTRTTFPKLVAILFVVSFVPLPEWYLVGNQGLILFTPLTPILLVLSLGLVSVVWGVLNIILYPLEKLARLRTSSSREQVTYVQRGTVLSMLLIFVVIFLFVPWQVAYLGCWLIQLYTCAQLVHHRPEGLSSAPDSTAIPLLRRDEDEPEEPPVLHRPSTNREESLHLLLLMTWLLPLAAPVLVVWVRTLATAGITTPFSGDHDFFNVAPFLILVDFASWNHGTLFERQSFERYCSVRWTLAGVSSLAFVLGSRKPYLIFDWTKVAMGLIVLVRIGPRYVGRPGWSPTRTTKYTSS